MCKVIEGASFFTLLAFSAAFAVQIHPVVKDGRQIQLDGFLLEWKKSDARPLGRDSSWSWDVINTREGLTGYFKSGKISDCKGGWTFRFLPNMLSSYHSLDVHTEGQSNEERFFRVANGGGGNGAGIVCEWIIPWGKVSLDSSGAYQVGLFAFDSCRDSLPPTILTGHVYNPKKPSWGGVYGKMILVGIMLVLLFIIQKKTRGKFQKRK